MMRATDICSAKPDWVARRLVDRGFTPRYDHARQGLDDVSYRAWREYDAEDAVRFWTPREREIGLTKSSPEKIISQPSQEATHPGASASTTAETSLHVNAL